VARPKKSINPKTVERLAKIGCSAEEIAAVLDCNVSLIKRRFTPVVQKGRLYLQQTVRSMLVRKAREGNVSVIIFLGKALLGLRENDPVSINVSNTDVLALGVPDDQRKKIEQLAHEIQQRTFMRYRKPEALTTANGEHGNGDTQTPAQP
jgi:hypothetical protein